MTREIADAFDDLAKDFKRHARESTTGATEQTFAHSVARLLTNRAARLRSAADDRDDEAARRRAAEAAEAERASLWDPAQHTINEVNDYLASASTEEQARVLALEAQDRADVPEQKKQRAGILAGPHANV